MITDDQKWVPIGQAAVMLGVSERTVRNYIQSGKVPVHKDRGRTYVDVRPILAERPSEFQGPNGKSGSDFEAIEEGNPGTLLKIIGAELALRGQAQEMMSRIEHETETLRIDLQGARRSGRRGWALVGILLIGTGVAGAWSARELQRRDGQVETAQAQVVLHAGAVASAEGRVQAARERYDQAVKDYEAQLGQMREALTETRKRLDERVAAEVERAGTEAERREEAARVELSALAQIEILDRKLTDAQQAVSDRQETVKKLEAVLESERMKVALQSEKRVGDAEAVAQAETKIEFLERAWADAKAQVARLQDLLGTEQIDGEPPASGSKAEGDAAVNAPGEPLNGSLAKGDPGSRAPIADQPAVDATAQASPD